VSAASNQFLEAASRARLVMDTPCILVDGQTAFMRWCSECEMITPHKLTTDGSACGVCEKETIRQPAAQPAL